jgi:hypothetical protein
MIESGRDALKVAVLLLAAVVLLIPPSVSVAAFPGGNGRIAVTARAEQGTNIFAVEIDNPASAFNVTAGPERSFDQQAAWSPDGRRLLFFARSSSFGPDRDGGIYVVNADGTGLRKLSTPNLGSISDPRPTWSPNGIRFLFRGIGAFLYLGHIDSGEEGSLGVQGDSPAWSPKNDLISYSERGHIRTATPAGTNVRELLPDLTGEERAVQPAFSPNGERIAFVLREGCCDQSPTLMTMKTDGTDVRAVPTTPFHAAWPAWSPDGTEIAFEVIAGSTPADFGSIWRQKLDGSDQRLVHPDADHPDWQPLNRGPDCSKVKATPAGLDPSGRRLNPAELTGASHPDGNAVTTEITGVTQDEPVTGRGDPTSPDAVISATSTLEVRGERSPQGDGRVYRIGFEVRDADGDSCAGEATVEVRRHKKDPAVDSSPPRFDSLTG